MANICPKCMANMDLVGRVHNCRVPVIVPTAEEHNEIAAGVFRTKEVTREELEEEFPSTYRYRDSDKRRAYMREYMRKRRS